MIGFLIYHALISSVITADNNGPYCFRMTWIGPKTVKKGIFEDLNCEDYTFGYDGVPCRKPLVATYSDDESEIDNQYEPDYDNLWMKYKDTDPTKIACRLNKNDVCLKHVYTYNNKGFFFIFSVEICNDILFI